MKDPCPIFRWTSMLYRAGQAFYDRQLKHHGIGSGQQFFLLRVYEEPGISVLELAQRGGYDNGTATRAIQKLESQGYVRILPDEEDRRVRRIYITDKAMSVIKDTYAAKREWNGILMEGLTAEEQAEAEQLMARISQNARSHMREGKDQ